jgi:putative membrane protein
MGSVLTLAATIGDLIPIAHWDGDAPGWWIVFVPLFWFLVIFGIVLLVRARGGSGPPWSGRGRETGIEVLERRFAEGELSLEQYRERRSVLEEKS